MGIRKVTQQLHGILFTPSWTVPAGREREPALEQEPTLGEENGRHCRPGPKGHHGCQAHALPGLLLTHIRSNQTDMTSTNMCMSWATISKTLVTAAI